MEKISFRRKLRCGILNAIMLMCALIICLMLAGMVGYILSRGVKGITWEFLSTKPSLLRGTNGILPNILNTLYIILMTLIIVLPLGVGAAVYLNEYAKNKKAVNPYFG